MKLGAVLLGIFTAMMVTNKNFWIRFSMWLDRPETFNGVLRWIGVPLVAASILLSLSRLFN